MKFLLVDVHNIFHRASHVIKTNIDDAGNANIANVLKSLCNASKIFKEDHVVFFTDSSMNDNWRKDIYPEYKKNRKEKIKLLSPGDKRMRENMYAAMEKFLSFVQDHTNSTVLLSPKAEADDVIARWIEIHKNDTHIIVSSDGDFKQLMADNVIQMDGLNRKIYHHNFDTSQYRIPNYLKWEEIENPEYFLFEKTIRGDSSDGIFSAFPRVRKKSSKGKVGILEAFEDKEAKGFAWNNFMMNKWTDHNNEEQLVKDCYDRNKQLIDLTAQPDDVKKAIDENIVLSLMQKKAVHGVGFLVESYIEELESDRLLDDVDYLSSILSTTYPYRSLFDAR